MAYIIFFGILFVVSIIITQIGARINKKKRAAMKKHHFTLRRSRGTVVFLIFGSIFFFGLILLMILSPYNTEHWLIAVTLGVVGLMNLLFAFSNAKWQLSVKDDTITIKRFGTQTFKIDDVATVQRNNTGLLIHLENGEKIEVLGVVGIDLLATFLQEAGKFDYLQQHEKLNKVRNLELAERDYEFELKNNNKLVIYFYFIVAASMMVVFIIALDNDILTAILFCVGGISFIGLGLHVLRWQATVNFSGITIRNTFGKVKSYSMSDISKVNTKNSGRAYYSYYVSIYVGKKRIAKISSGIEHVDCF